MEQCIQNTSWKMKSKQANKQKPFAMILAAPQISF
jgi:hypothetical protein